MDYEPEARELNWRWQHALHLISDLKHLTCQYLLGDIENVAFSSERARLVDEIEKCVPEWRVSHRQ